MSLYTVVLFVGLIATVSFVHIPLAGEGSSRGRAVLLFLGFLPLLNAWADFASIGLTRWRLRAGIRGHLVANTLIDAAAALFILLALAFAVIATIHCVRPPGGAPLFDLADLFAGLRETPQEYWWLGFMLFSTLLPTLVSPHHRLLRRLHAVLRLARQTGRDGLTKGDSPEGRAAALALTICAALAVWVPCLLIVEGARLIGQPLLGLFLDICEAFARWIGAI